MLIALLIASLSTAHAEDEVKVKLYGTVKPTVALTGGAVESYGRPNESAITAAANPRLVTDADQAHLSWQVAQSRFGIQADAGDAQAVLELDFIDFNVATPTTGARPRLRQATVGWSATDATTLTLGQTWDIFAPLNPLHRNLVGGSFQAGNLGFMRQQAIIDHKSKALHLSGALGLAGSNNGVSDAALELTPRPTVAGRAAARLGDTGEVGAAGFFAKVALSEEDLTTAWGGQLFADLKLGDKTQLRSEAFVGQNLQSTGMLTLAQARLDPTTGDIIDLQEAGAWISLRQGVGEGWAVTATVNGDWVLNSEDVVANYTPATDDSTLGVLDATTPGMTHNAGGRVGLERKAASHLILYGEGFGLNSAHVQAEGDPSDQGLRATRFGGELGAVFSF